MEDLRGIGLMVNPSIPKGQTNLRVTEDQPLEKENNLSLGSIVVFGAPGPSVLVRREDFEITSQDHLASPSHAFQGHGGEGSDGPGGWSLTPVRPVLIIGDANLAYLPLIEDNSIQVDSYPGWDMSQATFLLRNRTPTSPAVNTVILYLGRGGSDSANPTRMDQQLEKLLETATATFPNARICLALINISASLTRKDKVYLKHLNSRIKETPNSIPLLEEKLFARSRVGSLWTPNTGEKMWAHWKSCLSITPVGAASGGASLIGFFLSIM